MAAEIEYPIFLNTRQVKYITKYAQTIVEAVTTKGILRPEYTLGVDVLPEFLHGVEEKHSVKNINVTFNIDLTENISVETPPSMYDNYCSGLYYNEQTNGLPFVCQITDVKSKGNRVGVFLTHLQILLALKVNCRWLELDNMTDEPGRAASGIYSMFTPYAKGVTVKKSDSLADQLISTFGHMRLLIDSGTREQWIQTVLSMTIDETLPPWGVEAISKIQKMVTEDSQHSTHFGGKPKRKSKRYKHTKRFRNKRFRNKRFKTKRIFRVQ